MSPIFFSIPATKHSQGPKSSIISFSSVVFLENGPEAQCNFLLHPDGARPRMPAAQRAEKKDHDAQGMGNNLKELTLARDRYPRQKASVPQIVGIVP